MCLWCWKICNCSFMLLYLLVCFPYSFSVEKHSFWLGALIWWPLFSIIPFSLSSCHKAAPSGIQSAIIASFLSFLGGVTEFFNNFVYPNGGNVGVLSHTLTRNWSLQQIALDFSLPLWSRVTNWLTIYTFSNRRYYVDISSNGISVPMPSHISLLVSLPWPTQPQNRIPSLSPTTSKYNLFNPNFKKMHHHLALHKSLYHPNHPHMHPKLLHRFPNQDCLQFTTNLLISKTIFPFLPNTILRRMNFSS